jgi:HAD superfamily hydrolase (TIGR01509 family)
MDVKAVVFDCDGVLFDSRQANVNYYNELLARFGRGPMDAAEEQFVHAHTGRQSVERLFKDDPRRDEALAFERGRDYTPFIGQMIPRPGMRRLLTALRGRCATAMFTNRTRTVGAVLDHFDLHPLFHLVVSADKVRPKPHPEGLLYILDVFGVRGEETIYVGDTAVDEQSAADAGVRLISFDNPDLKAELVAPDFITLGRWLGVDLTSE